MIRIVPLIVVSSAVFAGACRERPAHRILGHDYPLEAMDARWQKMVDENGRIPPDALVKAKQQRDAMAATEATGGVDPGSWRWAGPSNIAGRVRALYIHPEDANTMVLGSASGGLWRTSNAGVSWRFVDDWLPSLSISSLVSHRDEPDVIYAGTGDHAGTVQIRGAGVFKSTDSGLTWTRLASTAGRDFIFVNGLAISPAHSRVLLAATDTGVFRSNDAGVTWTPRLSSPTFAWDVQFHPTSGTRAVASGLGQLLFSDDGGTSWTAATGVPPSFGRVELAYAESDPRIVYAAMSIRTGMGALYMSVDGGASYRLRSLHDFFTWQGSYDNAIWVDPTDFRRVVVGGIGLWRAVDSGGLWDDINSPHPDQHFVVSHPDYDGASNRVVFVGTDGGLCRYDDILDPAPRATWLNDGLGIIQFHGGAVAADGRPIGGAQDRGTWMRISTLSPVWRRLQGFDGLHCAADPSDYRWVYGTSQFSGLFRSWDAGTTIDRIEPPSPLGAPFVTPILLDPNNARRMFIGNTELMVTDDVKSAGKPTWRALTDFETAGQHVTQFAVAPGRSDRIYLVHNGRDLWATDNGTSASPDWSRADGGLPNRWITSIAFDPRNIGRVYVSLGGFNHDNVWVKEGFQPWRDISGDLPSVPVMSFAVHPRIAGWLYAGTEIGLFVSVDDGLSWSPTNEGPANVAIEHLVFHRGETLWAFTHGRGAYYAHASTPHDSMSATARASVDSFELEADDDSTAPTITADGRHVAFSSRASNLILADTNNVADVFVRDTQAGTTVLASARGANVEGNGASTQPSIARAGRYVAFRSEATNLVAGDTNQVADVFVRDLMTQTTERVSLADDGSEANHDSMTPSISADGRYVVFTSLASNLVADDTNGRADVFLRDRVLETTQRVSSAWATGGPATGSSSNTSRAISADGRYVIFQSDAPDLFVVDDNNVADVFLVDRELPRPWLISRDTLGRPGNGASSSPCISDDGQLFVFESFANNLVAGDTNNVADVFLADQWNHTLDIVSRASSGGPGNGSSLAGSLSPDGRYVAFYSGATNLVEADTNSRHDVFVRDLDENRTLRVSVDASGREANGDSFFPDVGRNGVAVAFYSSASDLVAGDLNARQDVFVARPGWSYDVFPGDVTLRDGTGVDVDTFGHASTRMQLAYRETRGRPMTIRGISFRGEGGQGTAAALTADMQLLMAPCDIDRLAPSFKANFGGASTTVVSRRPVRLPALGVTPRAVRPFDVTIPLDRPYAHDGVENLGIELQVFSNDSKSGVYPFDAHSANRTELSTSAMLGSGCSTNNGTFSHNLVFESSGSQSTLTAIGDFAPANASTFLVIGVADPNVSLPAICGQLHATTTIVVDAGAAGAGGNLKTTFQLPPWRPGFRGNVLYSQLVGLDLAGPQIALSNGRRVVLPTQSPGPVARSVFAVGALNFVGEVRDTAAVIRLDQ